MEMTVTRRRGKPRSWVDQFLSGRQEESFTIPRSEFGDSTADTIRGIFYKRASQRGLRASVIVNSSVVTVRSMDADRADNLQSMLTYLDLLRRKVLNDDLKDANAVVRRLVDVWECLKG